MFVDYATIYFGGDNRKGFTQLLDTYKAKLRGNEIDVIHVVMGPIQRIEGFDNLAHFMYYAITRSEPGLPAWFHIHCDDSLQLYERRQWGAEFLEEWIKNGVFLNEIFERVTGMPEAAGMALPFVRNETDELTYIHNPLTNQGFCCGKITHSTLAQLRAQELEAPVSLGAPSFTVICYIGTKPARYAEADICALQAHPDNNGAVFQLASRFHALEGGTAHGGLNKATTQKPNCGFFSGMSKPVQGEYASFSAAPGTIFKMYGPESINLLAGTPFGHLINPEQSDGGMPTVAEIIKIAQTIPENWTDNLQIYFHEEIDVVVGQQTKPPKSWQARAETEKRQFILRQPLNRIHQIPVASFDWANLNKADVPRLSQITQQMLCGFYEGTLLSAALHGKRKIFLTAVGGGSFHNNLDVILAAIANDRNLGIIQKYGLEVTLVIHEINAQERVGCWVHVIDGVYKTPDFEYHGADLSTPYIVRGKFNII
ncbi:MAG: hypothetical protein US22_C0058G0003 [candidate division TM6 bacterium GW2011_GWF2_36_6]|nr:MAG: hypothetical protein US22_C0058G0003 [candidate division TM6 bacterium GW2011_GWF2_36_6]